jgi:hypothetical protein
MLRFKSESNSLSISDDNDEENIGYIPDQQL